MLQRRQQSWKQQNKKQLNISWAADQRS